MTGGALPRTYGWHWLPARFPLQQLPGFAEHISQFLKQGTVGGGGDVGGFVGGGVGVNVGGAAVGTNVGGVGGAAVGAVVGPVN